MAFERPFPDIPLFEDYHRITNRSEQPSTSVSLLVNAMAERCFLMKSKKITYVIFKTKKSLDIWYFITAFGPSFLYLDFSEPSLYPNGLVIMSMSIAVKCCQRNL